MKALNAKIYEKMASNDSKSYLSYLNKLAGQYNNSDHHSVGKKPNNADYLIWTKKNSGES